MKQLATEVNEGNTFEGWTIILMNDIDLSSVCSESSGKSWTPIGVDGNHPFQGTFDGNNKKLTNLWIKKEIDNAELEWTCIGLFGHTKKSEIKNLEVSGTISYSSDKNKVDLGGLIGNFQDGNIENVVCDVNISSEDGVKQVGGFVGWCDDSTFTNCVNKGAIKCNNKACGGIVGQGTGLKFKGCLNSGNIVCKGFSGGIIGYDTSRKN